MSIKFKALEKGQPGVVGGGEKKFYASSVSSGETSLEDLTNIIQESCTVNGADIRAVLYAMVSAAGRAMANGQIVRLGDLGSLRFSINSRGEATANAVTAQSIDGVKTIFTPGPKLKDTMKTLKFEKIQ